MMTGVRQDHSDLLQVAYNRKYAVICVFEVVLICAHIHMFVQLQRKANIMGLV